MSLGKASICEGLWMNESARTVEARCHDVLNLIQAYMDGKTKFEGLVRGLENGING